MQINVSGHQVAVTPALHDYAVGKLERIVRHFDHLHDVTVTLSVEKLLQKAEATLHCANNKIIHADAQAADLYAAIDAARRQTRPSGQETQGKAHPPPSRQRAPGASGLKHAARQ